MANAMLQTYIWNSMTKRLLTLFAFVLLAFLAAGSPARADIAASKWAETEQTAVRLIASRDGLGTDGYLQAGLEFRMKPGWKVYWRSPGDAGFPPIPDFETSENANIGPLSWPVPVRFSVLGLETLGYEDAVVLPFEVVAPDPSKPTRVNASVRYLTCKEICIPYDASLSMDIPAEGGSPTIYAHTIGQFASKVPRTSDAARLKISEAWTEASEKGLYIVASAASELPLKSPDLYLEGPVELGLGFGAPAISIKEGKQEALLRVPVSGFSGTPREAAQELASRTFTFTLTDSARAMEARLELSDPRPYAPGDQLAPPSEMASQSLGLILVFAFIGGLILNLMPCVLPVLSLKFLSVVKHGDSTPGKVRVSFLASAAGIVAAFLLLAAALIALKNAGAGIGWGIQFQQPWFIIIMAILVTLFACNMWGFFEFRLPGWLSSAAHDGSQRDGIVGHFLQGMFATLLATPCSAPFLGTAVGFALSQGSAEILSVFAMLGVGLAAPYLLIAAVPKLATMMPSPGAWMGKLKFVLGLALAATALWLLSVLSGAAGTQAAFMTGGILIAIALWLGMVMPRVPEIRRATPFVLLFATFAAITHAEVGDLDAPLDAETPGISKIAWQKFDAAAIPGMIANGRIVFVDVTADWCITCLVNKRLVLEQGQLLEILNGPNVVAMQADWTRPDADIAEYLASFGRYGIPFNAIYGERRPDGVALPELLSLETVLSGFRAAVPETLAQEFR